MMMKEMRYNGLAALVGKFATLLASRLLLFSSCLTTGNAPATVEEKVTMSEDYPTW
jgi:hypothetical protein